MKINRFLFFILFTSPVGSALPNLSTFSQQEIFIHWIENRCIAKIAETERLKQDANQSAAVWLEYSQLPVDAFNNADKLINEEGKISLSGSVKGEYNVLRCTLIANSTGAVKIYKSFAN